MSARRGSSKPKRRVEAQPDRAAALKAARAEELRAGRAEHERLLEAQRRAAREDAAYEHLTELLIAYGWAKRPRPGWGPDTTHYKRAAVGRAEERAPFNEQLGEAAPLLSELVARVRELRGPELLPPAQYAERWRAVIELWNDQIAKKRWLDLPPLCSTCGTPITLYPLERLKRGDKAPTFACSALHAKATRERLRRKPR